MYSPRELLRGALSMAYPNRCPFCDGYIGAFEYMHESCHSALPFIGGKRAAPEELDELYVCCRYEGAARDAVLRLKNGSYIFAAEAIGIIMAENAAPAARAADVITFVPSDRFSAVIRGYVPAGEIAAEISRRIGTPRAKLLCTDKRTAQKSLTAKERAENVRDAFDPVNVELIYDKKILLVDDICTTGCTISECARVLRECGAASVAGAVFAQAAWD